LGYEILTSGSCISVRLEAAFGKTGAEVAWEGLGEETPTVCVEMISDIATMPGSKFGQVLAAKVPGLCEVTVLEDDGRERRCWKRSWLRTEGR
jgi:hypothetical protein